MRAPTGGQGALLRGDKLGHRPLTVRIVSNLLLFLLLFNELEVCQFGVEGVQDRRSPIRPDN